MIHRSKSLLVLLVAALTFGFASAQEGGQQAQDPAAQAPQQGRFADPRWTAPAWRGPAWWDPRFYQVDVAMVRVAHLSPNTDPVDVVISWPDRWWGGQDAEPVTPEGEEFAEGSTTLEGLEYEQVTDYVMVPAGTHRISVLDPEGEQVALYEDEIDLNGESYYTIAAVGFVMGTDEELDARIREEQETEDEGFFEWLGGLAETRDTEDLTLRLEAYDDVPGNVPGAGFANVRVINAAAGSPDIDVRAVRQPLDDEDLEAFRQQRADPAAPPAAAAPPMPEPVGELQVASELSFPLASGYERVRTLGYDVEVRDLATDQTILGFSGDELRPGSVYTVLITGTAVADFPVEAILLEDVRIVTSEVDAGGRNGQQQEGQDGQQQDGQDDGQEQDGQQQDGNGGG